MCVCESRGINYDGHDSVCVCVCVHACVCVSVCESRGINYDVHDSVCVCVERERERARERKTDRNGKKIRTDILLNKMSLLVCSF